LGTILVIVLIVYLLGVFTISKMKNPIPIRSSEGLPLRFGTDLLPAASMSGLALTLLAVLTGTLGVWRLAADPGWTSPFFVDRGLPSRYQLWFAVALAADHSHSPSIDGRRSNE